MDDKTTQEEIVYQIIKDNAPIRTEQIKVLAMREGISCADRLIRYEQQKGKIVSFKRQGDKTKTWCLPNQQLLF